MKTGDKIKLNKKQRETIEPLLRNCQDAQAGYEAAARYVKITNDWLWRSLHGIFPELKNFHSSLTGDILTIHNKVPENKKWRVI